MSWFPKITGSDFEDSFFKYSLAISCLLHIAAFFQISYTNTHYSAQPVNKIEVVYNRQPAEASKPESAVRKTATKTAPLLPEKNILLEKQREMISPVEKFRRGPEKIKLGDRLASRIDPVDAKRKITVPMVESEKISSPVYLSYYQLVRDRIKEKVAGNYTQLDTGKVYLTFILLSDGSLQRIRLVDAKTSATSYLKNIGLQSIREASPFPNFPKDLDYPELSFNVVISFEAR